MTEEELQRLIENGENEQVEFKINPPRLSEIAERLCGMANTRQGGIIIFGVEDEPKNPIGLKDPNKAIDSILQATRLVKPIITLGDVSSKVYTINGAKLVVAQILPNNGELYQAGNTFWIRKGSFTIAMTREEVEERLRLNSRVPWEKLICPGTTIEDLDVNLIERYFSPRAERSRRNLRHTTSEELLVGLNCLIVDPITGKLCPTNAGILMFGYDPQLFLPHSEVVCIHYEDELGVGGYLDRKNLTGNLPELIDKAAEFLELHTRVGGKISGFKRADLYEYPMEALREAVVNSLVHRDYTITGESIRIFIYPDRVEVHSPGRLPLGITIDQLTNLTVGSRPRNPALAQFLRDIPGYMEKVGMGIRLMLKEASEMGLPAPEFRETHEFIVTFRNGQKITSEITSLNSRQLLALQLIREKGSISNGEYRSVTKVSESTCYRELGEMVKREILVARGIKRNMRYYLP